MRHYANYFSFHMRDITITPLHVMQCDWMKLYITYYANDAKVLANFCKFLQLFEILFYCSI